MDAPYRLFTLGGLRLVRADGTVVTGAAAQQRALAILAVLAVAGTRGVSREWLLALLWPESSEERARHALAQVLYNIRRGLEPLHAVASAGGSQLRLDPDVVAADVRAFEDALQAGETARALACWSGDFLAGVHLSGVPSTFEGWVDGERARLTALYRRALDREARHRESIGEFADAATLLHHRVALDPLDVPPTIALMSALARAGDVAGALETASRHAALRRVELDADPDPAVASLAERIRRAGAEQVVAATAARPTPRPGAVIRNSPVAPPPEAPPREAPPPTPPPPAGPPARPTLPRSTLRRW